MKTLLNLKSENQSLFDGSTNGTSIKKTGQIKAARSIDMLTIDSGYLEVESPIDLSENDAFTLEAAIKPASVTGKRQNLIESQAPPVAFFIDDSGFLNGSIHTERGWEIVKSSSTVEAGRKQNVRFAKDSAGNTVLEIDGKVVGKSKISAKVKNVGNLNFKIGAGMDGRNYQFKGELGNVSISKGFTVTETENLRIKNARQLTETLKQKLGNINIYVAPHLNEGHARLQPIKNIMNAAGVERLSDLSVLQIKTVTTMTPGKVLIAPKKTTASGINWLGLTQNFATLKKAEKQEFLAKYLVNRNSTATLKKADETTTPPKSLTARIPTTGRIPVRTTPIPVLTESRSAGLLRAVQPKIDYTGFIHLDKSELSVFNKDVLLKNLESFEAKDLPQMNIKPYSLTLNVDTSVIIAGTLDLTNTELRIDNTVQKLYIIAEKLICGPNAKITWRRSGRPAPSPIANDPNLNGRSYSGVHTKPNSRDGIDGENGRAGAAGITGYNGYNGPSIEIWVKEMTNIPNIDLNGEDGIKGGKGQKGGNGGRGANGKVGERIWFFGWHCTADPGDGGDGGDGGRGGNGGRGGSGGRGGNISIGVLDGTLGATVTAGQFQWKNQGGQKGLGGDPGSGGTGGAGGRSGVGDTCKDAKNGHNGAQGQPGAAGGQGHSLGADGSDQFFEFSEEAWDDMMTRPWITEINPREIFPGNTITIRGSKFTANDRVIIEGVATLAPTVNPDESISVTVPNTISGGTKSIYVKRFVDNVESNRFSVRIKPLLDASSVPASIPPLTTVVLRGKAFLPDATVLVNGESLPGTVNTSGTEVTFTTVGTGGEGSAGGTIVIAVRNTDGMLSNSATALTPRVLEIPFTYGVHNLPFGNFTDGIPSWSTFEDTFGAVEVWHESLDPVFGHPILTAAYFQFYKYFLKGTANGGLATGFCTSLSALVADKLWQGINNANTTTKSSVHQWLTAVHGKLLSRESLIHFHDQSRQGIQRVELTARAIERTFLTGCDRNVAPLLFFIPSGAIWSEGYIDQLGSTHCIMPYRFVYPEGHPGPQLAPGGFTTISNLDGVQMFCWDCNRPNNPNCRVEFRMQSGNIHFSYRIDNSIVFDSNDNITLGHMSNGDYLLADHDLPFSGPFGLTSFVIDFLLSPADLQVTNENGLRLGNFNGSIFSEIPDSHPAFLAKGMYLIPEGESVNRKIVGNGTGKYTFNTLMPDGTSLIIEDVSTKLNQVDHLTVNADSSQVRFRPHEQKEFNITYSKLVNDQLRAVSIQGISAAPDKEVDLTVSPNLEVLRLGNRDVLRNVTVKAFSIDKTANQPLNFSVNQSLPVNHDLVISVADWNSLNVNVETLEF